MNVILKDDRQIHKEVEPWNKTRQSGLEREKVVDGDKLEIQFCS